MSEVTEAHKQELVKVKKEIERKEMDLETLKKQCKQQSEEYFRLADRNNELERKGLPVENRKDKWNPHKNAHVHTRTRIVIIEKYFILHSLYRNFYFFWN